MNRPTPRQDTPSRQTTPPDEVSALARTYGRSVYLAAFRVLGDPAQAEDVQQDVFLRLLLRPVPEVESWPAMLQALAVRTAIDQLRRRMRWRRLMPVWLAGAEQDAPEGADAYAIRMQQARQLRQALARLHPREAECFTLRCLQGMDVADIARAMGMKPNHVSVSLHRAARKLEAELGTPAPLAQETL